MRQAIIKFDENMSRGSQPDRKHICMYIEMPKQTLRIYNLLSDRDNASFCSCQHRKFNKLRSLLELWEAMGIDARIHKRFARLEDWEEWRKTVYFCDYEVHWQVFLQQEDGSWDLYLEQSLAFPTALEQIYRLAASMKRP